MARRQKPPGLFSERGAEMEQRRPRSAPVYFKPETDSTNLAARRLAAEGAPDGTVFYTLRQSAGRGRLGRSFASPEGGLYYTMLLDAAEVPEQDLLLTPAAGLAVCRALERICALHCGIKWPNDLLLEGKKLCGILVEGFAAGERRCLALGIGINVNTDAFPPELREIAVSIRQVTGRETDIAALAGALTVELDKTLPAARGGSGALLKEYRERCLTVGHEIFVIQNGECREATALGVNEDYSLAVRFADGQEAAVSSGEVSIR